MQQGWVDGAQARVGLGGLGEGRRELAATAPGRGAKRLELMIAEDAGGLDEASMDLRLGQGPVGWRQQRPTKMKDVAGELEVEEGRLVLFELGHRGKNIVGQA